VPDPGSAFPIEHRPGRIVELGRSARAEAKVKTRQPLSRALIPSAAFVLLVNCWLFHLAFNGSPPARPNTFVVQVWRFFPSMDAK